MKKEKLLLNQIELSSERKVIIQELTMRLYYHDWYSIICDNQEMKFILTDLFQGNTCPVGEKNRLNGKKIRNAVLMKNLKKECAVITKKSKLISAFSIAENICMFSDISKWDYKNSFMQKTEFLFQQFQVNIALDKPVHLLTEIERIVIELLKAYVEKREIVVLSGLSEFLDSIGLKIIHCILSLMQRESQSISVVIIDNPCEPVFEWSNRIQVLKRDRDYGCFCKKYLERDKVYEFYSSHKKATFLQKEGIGFELDEYKEVVSFHNVNTVSLHNITFKIDEGEVLKIFCFDEKSRAGILNIFSGNDSLQRGEIWMDGQNWRNSIRKMKRGIISICHENAFESSLISEISVRDNILIELYHKISNILIHKKYCNSIDQFIIENLGRGYADKKVHELTIYERQRLIFLKYYLTAPKVLIFENLFYNTDVLLKEINCEGLKYLTQRGIAVILLTGNLENLSEADGENIYLQEGTQVDEEIIYRALYQ